MLSYPCNYSTTTADQPKLYLYLTIVYSWYNLESDTKEKIVVCCQDEAHPPAVMVSEGEVYIIFLGDVVQFWVLK